MIKYRIDPDALAYAAKRSGLTHPDGGIDYGKTEAASGVPRATIRDYAVGSVSKPSASYLIQLADALGVDPHDLMIETEDE